MFPEAFLLDCYVVRLIDHILGGGRRTLYPEVRKENVCDLAILKLEISFHKELMEAHNSSSDEPVIAVKSPGQKEAGGKPYKASTIGDNGTNYGHDPDLLVLRLFSASAYCCLDLRESLDCELASAFLLC